VYVHKWMGWQALKFCDGWVKIGYIVLDCAVHLLPFSIFCLGNWSWLLTSLFTMNLHLLSCRCTSQGRQISFKHDRRAELSQISNLMYARHFDSYYHQITQRLMWIHGQTSRIHICNLSSECLESKKWYTVSMVPPELHTKLDDPWLGELQDLKMIS
jgi:hypothetical protein